MTKGSGVNSGRPSLVNDFPREREKESKMNVMGDMRHMKIQSDMEIAQLKACLLTVTLPASSPPVAGNHSFHGIDKPNMVPLSHSCGKAPPIDSFHAEGLVLK